MDQIIRCGIIIGGLLGIFFLLGMCIVKFFKLSVISKVEYVILGFFMYFIVFQFVALPVVLYKGTLDACIKLFILVFSLLFLICLIYSADIWKQIFTVPSMGLEWNRETAIAIVSILGVLFMMVFATLQPYHGADTSYYIGNMNISLNYRIFYEWAGDTGWYCGLPIRRALSTFFIMFTVLADLFSIEARIIAFYCARPLCVIMTVGMVHLLGIQLFHGNKIKANLLLFFWTIFNFFQTSIYASPSFLLQRGYEAKGYCANVLPLAFFCAVLFLTKNSEEKKGWIWMLLLAYASVPISISAIAIIPWGIMIVGIWLMIKSKKIWHVVVRCIACVIPNLYYFLFMIS